MSDDEYGPALPPGLLKKKNESEIKVSGPQLPPHLRKKSEENIESNSSSDNEASIEPILPPHLRKGSPSGMDIIGPAMPPGMNIIDNVSSEEESIGPKLPQHLKNYKRDYSKTESFHIGPQLPDHLTREKSYNIGPSLPPDIQPKGDDSSSDDDNDVIGPMPCEMLMGDNSKITVAEIESRARQMRDKLEGKEKKEEKLSRESWMMELPSNKLSMNLGLQARSFRAKAGPDLSDRSGWTDTPLDKEKKNKEQEETVSKKKKRSHGDVSSRDKQLSKDVKKYNKTNRPESLLDIHQKELKSKKQKTEDKPTERKPFDREQDLQVNKFDDAQRKSIIKKSQKLDSRFSHGGSQFL